MADQLQQLGRPLVQPAEKEEEERVEEVTTEPAVAVEDATISPYMSCPGQLPDNGLDGDTDELDEGPVPFSRSLWSLLWVNWLERGLLKRCRELGPDESLSLSDCYALPPGVSPRLLADSYGDSWRRELSRRGDRASVMLASWRVHSSEILLCVVVFVAMALVSLLDPLFVNLLITYAGDPSATILWGVFLALAFFCSRMTFICLENFAVFYRERIGQTLKSGMVALIFRKTLILRQDSFLSFSAGKMNNMITTDVDKARMLLVYCDGIITIPVKVVIVVAALFHLFGMALWPGISFMLIWGNLTQPLMSLNRKCNMKVQKLTDERVRIVGEIMQAINIVKCYAWEEPAAEKVAEARKKEIAAMWRVNKIDLCTRAILDALSPVTLIIIFVTYAILYPERPLTAATVFTAVNLLGTLRGSLWQLPWMLTNFIEARVSSRRIKSLLLLPEARLPATACIRSLELASAPQAQGQASNAAVPAPAAAAAVAPSRGDDAVVFKAASFVWPAKTSEDGEEDGSAGAASQKCCGRWLPFLRRRRLQARAGAAEASRQLIDLEGAAPPEGAGPAFELAALTLAMPTGSFMFVIGATASGKTSFLQAILGEMPFKRDAGGECHVDRARPIAFAPQQPWIFNATCRDNILFGAPYNASHYRKCVKYCQLEADFALLSAGDLTRVGEKGIALSGGQKARLGLARAVYRSGGSELFVLDDPYSALDVHVAQKVHKKVACELLGSKSRVLVTNSVEFIPDCDILVVLDKGRIEMVGSYAEVRSKSAVLETLLKAREDSNAKLTLQRVRSSESDQPPVDLERAVSRGSEFSAEGEDEQAAGQAAAVAPMEGEAEEARATGNLKFEVIWYYIQKMGGVFIFSMVCLGYFAAEGLRMAGLWWLSQWTARDREGSEESFYLAIYVAFVLGNCILNSVMQACSFIAALRAAVRIHDALFSSVVRTPMHFFQKTPHGQIINRFSRDTNEVDKSLGRVVAGMMTSLISTISCLAMVGANAVASFVLFLPLIRVYIVVQRTYNRAATETKRLSKISNSPVYDHFSNICRENGLSVVRAFHAIPNQIQMSNRLITQQMRCPMTTWYVVQWYYQRVEPLGAVLVLLVSLFIAVGHNKFVHTNSAALALSLSMELIGRLPMCLRMYTELTLQFNCVERVLEYIKELPDEAPAIVESNRPGPDWPTAGELEVKDLRLRYGADKPLVLHGLSFTVAAGEHIGVVGRTGAGKSSMLTALFRIVEPEPGSVIRLDGQDILTMGLRDLRSRITMIPQEPVLFQATLRYNCDPFGEHSDAAIMEALQEAQLGSWLRERHHAAQVLHGGSSSCSSPPTAPLETEVQDGGQNLSAGQRQMVALARAMLRRSKLVVLDEATAAMDAATDAMIQRAIRSCFAGASSLTIAHRLGTIMDSDRIMVLDRGLVAELGTPDELQRLKGGIFRSMAKTAEGASTGSGAR